MSLKRRIGNLEARLGVVGRQEEQLIAQEHWDEATKRLADDELAAMEDACERFEHEDELPVEELTDRELRAFYRLYAEVARIVGEEGLPLRGTGLEGYEHV